MKSRYLLPHYYRLIGWCIFIPFLVLGILTMHYDYEFGFLSVTIEALSRDFFADDGTQNFTNELAGIGIMVGLLFVAFSRERVEDEFIMKLRMESLVIAVFVNYGLLLIAMVFLYDFAFVYAMIYNMYTLLLFFILRFSWVRRRQQNMLEV